MTSFHVPKGDILLIIRSLDSSKAHGWDNISIKMIKICGEPITVSLKIIFEQSLKKKKFLELWKKATIILGHKKEDKNLLKIYHPVSLLLIFRKIVKELSIMPSSVILKGINLLHLLNQDLYQTTHV